MGGACRHGDFIIDALHTIETAQWNSPEEISEETKRGASVLVGLGEQRRLLQNLDLIADLRIVSTTVNTGPHHDIAPPLVALSA